MFISLAPLRRVREGGATSHRRQRLWMAFNEDDELLGLVMLCPHSKGGHLDNLAVSPQARGDGVDQALLHALLSDSSHGGSAIVTLPTRIPQFFVSLGFKSCGQLSDGSVAMMIILPEPSISCCD